MHSVNKFRTRQRKAVMKVLYSTKNFKHEVQEALTNMQVLRKMCLNEKVELRDGKWLETLEHVACVTRLSLITTCNLRSWVSTKTGARKVRVMCICAYIATENKKL